MIDLNIKADSNLVEAKINGALRAEDWETASPLIDKQIDIYGSVRLRLDATDFGGWNDMDAAKAHFQFVKAHHDNVDRIALIANKHWQHWLAGTANIFVNAQIKAFDEQQQKQAGDWLDGKESEPEAAIRILQRSAGNILGIKVCAKVRAVDYDTILVPAIEALIEQHGAMNMLVDMNDFAGAEIAAVWEDFKVGIRHMKDFKKVAVVGDQKWVEWMSRLMDPVTGFEIKSYLSADIEAAWDWLES